MTNNPSALSNYFSVSDKDAYTWESIKRQYPHQIELAHAYGDWGLGRSRVYLAFSEQYADGIAPDIVLLRSSNVNNPIGNSPGILEGIYIEGTEMHHIRALRDHLNTLLGEGN